ncbi:MAG: VacB/RNase II family 3'-5' exoribonuclease [Phycisphaerales bacterium]|nr:VacB/RNase II family 3'-5' exoribonuclease [Phycisphaerales bacterium]
MSQVFRAQILDHLGHNGYRPVRTRELERQMRILEDASAEFRATLDTLAHEDFIDISSDDLVRLTRYKDESIGKIRISARGGGSGYFIPEIPSREGDLYVADADTGGAVSGDRVRVAIVRRGAGWDRAPDTKPTARVVEVLARKQTRFAGALAKEGRGWIVVPDGKVLTEPIVVRDPGAKDAMEGDKVIVEITRFPDQRSRAEGVITRRLGVSGEPDAETASVIVTHNLPGEFPESVMDEAAAAARNFESHREGPWAGRIDLTSESIFTIDPPDARDFDDAISIAWNETTQEWTLGVHIADVAYFVPRGGALDIEARARATSAYLPRLVIPMLPETLSNGVCSLQEAVARFAKSVFITFDVSGKVLYERYASTVIRSRKRMTYLEAQAVIDGDLAMARRHAKTETPVDEALVAELRLCQRLATALRQRRLADGMIVLALPESELVYGADGRVKDVEPEDSAFTHTLIEMFMVEANEAVARLFASLSLPALRRIHPEPDFHDIEELRLCARAAKVRLPDSPKRKDLQALLDGVRGTDSERAIHFAVLRSMAKAVYSPALIGHFALASEHYLHFTSPIRRYPDLITHRMLEAWTELTDNGRAPPGGKRRRELLDRMRSDPRVEQVDDLVAAGEHCSEAEVNAEGAERELRAFLVLQFLKDHHMTATLTGVVTGISQGGGGAFVMLDRFLADGMIRVREMGSGQRWIRSDSTGRLTNPRSGASLGLGDAVEVKVGAIDLAMRQMDLTLVRVVRRSGGGGAGDDGKRGSEPQGKRDKGFVGGRGAPRVERGHKKGFKQGRRGKRGK